MTTSLLLLALLQSAGPDTWSEPPGPPVKVAAGGAMVAVDADTLVVLCGGNRADCFRYAISTATWTAMPLPVAVNAGGALAFRAGSVYATVGATAGRDREFHRYRFASPGWTRMADFPVAENDGLALAATASAVHAAGPGSSIRVYAPDDAGTSGGSWSSVAAPNGSYFSAGAALACPDPATDLVYALFGNGNPRFWTWSASRATPWIEVRWTPASASALRAGTALTAVSTTTLMCAVGGGSADDLYEYSIPGDSWTHRAGSTLVPPKPLGAPFGAGAALARPPGSPLLHLLHGGGSCLMGRWSLAAQADASTLALLPSTLLAAGGTPTGFSATGGGGAVHVMLSDAAAAELWHYSPASMAWTAAAAPPFPFVSGGASIACDENLVIHAADGNPSNYPKVASYSIGTDAWTDALAPVPVQVFGGSQLVSGRNGFLYYFCGGPARRIQRYEPAGDRWENISGLPAILGTGAGATLGADDTIFVLRGDDTRDVWTYSAGSNRWNEAADGSARIPTPIPAVVTNGSSIAWCPVDGLVYVLLGASSTGGSDLWSYDPPTDAWTPLRSAPAGCRGGSTLTYPGSGVHLYATAGSSSRVLWRYQVDPGSALAPASLAQRRLDGRREVPSGSTVRTPGLQLLARATHSRNRRVTIRAEVIPAAGSFSGVATVESDLVMAGTEVAMTVNGLAPGAYRWQAWGVNEADVAGPATIFDAGGASFVVTADLPPTGGAPFQLRTDTGEEIPTAGHAMADTLALGTTPTDADGDLVRIDIEVRPLAAPFTGTPTNSGEERAGASPARLSIPGLSPGDYHWAVRAVDEWGAAGPWIARSPGGEADFRILPAGSTGITRPCAASGGTGLLPLLAILLARGSFRARTTCCPPRRAASRR